MTKKVQTREGLNLFISGYTLASDHTINKDVDVV